MTASIDRVPTATRATPAPNPIRQPLLQAPVPAPGIARDGSWAPSFLMAHWAPVPVLVIAAVLLTTLHGDQWLADRIYALQGRHWALRSAFVTENLLHIVGRNISTLAWLVVLATWLVARSRPGLAPLRTPLVTLLVSTLLATALVAWIKSWSNMDCPWDLARYGGAREFVGLVSLRPVGMPRAACFPAGHAGAGYTWMALYFFFLATRPRWRWRGLAVGVSLGLLFGVVQQLRGAHFLSHDLWTAAICWTCALAGYLYSQRRTRREVTVDLPPAAGSFGSDEYVPAASQRSADAL